MKLIKVEYIEESTKAMYFNVTVEIYKVFTGTKTTTERAFMEKICDNKEYLNCFKWANNIGYNEFETAIKHNAVCPEDSHMWLSEFEEGEQNRFRNNNFLSFEDWCIYEIESLFED